MLFAKALQMCEAAAKPWTPKRTFARWDEQFYDTDLLSDTERQNYKKSIPEGTVLIVDQEKDSEIVECRGDICAKPKGTAAEDVLHVFNDAGGKHIDVFAIAGNASSAIGSIAMARTVARALKKKVATIVAGQGSLDWFPETLSGGFLMAPTAKMLYALDEPLECMVRFNPVVKPMIAQDLQEVMSSMAEAATLFEILKDRMVDFAGTKPKLRDKNDHHLQMIVGHSKANWPILTALLNFELSIGCDLERPADRMPRTHVVTLGNWVSLPDMDPIMRDLFHYHQFAGMIDLLAWAASTRGLRKMIHEWHFANGGRVDHSQNPDELVYMGCGHNLNKGNPIHLPIERILPELLAA